MLNISTRESLMINWHSYTSSFIKPVCFDICSSDHVSTFTYKYAENIAADKSVKILFSMAMTPGSHDTREH